MLFIGVYCLLLQQSLLALSFSNRYDRLIEKSVKKYWSDYPRAYSWKAQLYQESRLKAKVTSPVGASGLAQIMPKTKIQLWRELNFNQNISIFSVYHNIFAGAYYMRKQRDQWRWKRPLIDRNQLAQASYNAGLGHILKAQKICSEKAPAILYEEIIGCLPQVTGRHSKETITYIKRIKLWESYLK